MPTIEYRQTVAAHLDLRGSIGYVTEAERPSLWRLDTISAVGNSATSSVDIPVEIREAIFACQREEGWDLEEANAVTEEACRSALRFLETLLVEKPDIATPRVSASVLGAVTLEWRTGDRHLAVRIFPDFGPVFYISEEPQDIRAQGYEDRYRAIRRVVNFCV